MCASVPQQTSGRLATQQVADKIYIKKRKGREKTPPGLPRAAIYPIFR
jgi:hypothetical protein